MCVWLINQFANRWGTLGDTYVLFAHGDVRYNACSHCGSLCCALLRSSTSVCVFGECQMPLSVVTGSVVQHLLRLTFFVFSFSFDSLHVFFGFVCAQQTVLWQNSNNNNNNPRQPSCLCMCVCVNLEIMFSCLLINNLKGVVVRLAGDEGEAKQAAHTASHILSHSLSLSVSLSYSL